MPFWLPVNFEGGSQGDVFLRKSRYSRKREVQGGTSKRGFDINIVLGLVFDAKRGGPER